MYILQLQVDNLLVPLPEPIQFLVLFPDHCLELLLLLIDDAVKPEYFLILLGPDPLDLGTHELIDGVLLSKQPVQLADLIFIAFLLFGFVTLHLL